MDKTAKFGKNIKQVEIKTISIMGHETRMLGIEDAIAYLKKACDSQGKWAYIDGVPVMDSNAFTSSLIENAEDITLTNQLAGGVTA